MYLVLSSSGGQLGYVFSKLELFRDAYQHHGKQLTLVAAIENQFTDNFKLVSDPNHHSNSSGQLKAGYIVFLAIFFTTCVTFVNVSDGYRDPAGSVANTYTLGTWEVQAIASAFF